MPTLTPTRSQYQAMNKLLKMIHRGEVCLSTNQKLALRERYRRSGCGSREFGLVWSMDEYVISGILIDWGDNRPPVDNSRLVVVTIETDVPLMLSLMIIRGAPHPYEYCLSFQMAMFNTQKLSPLPPSRPAVLISDNALAAAPNFQAFCAESFVVHRHARPWTPHAKRAVESANHILQCRSVPPLDRLDFTGYTPDGSSIITCTARDYLRAALKGALDYHAAKSRGSTVSRSAKALENFDFFRLPLHRDELGEPCRFLSENIGVRDNKLITTNGTAFEFEGSEVREALAVLSR